MANTSSPPGADAPVLERVAVGQWSITIAHPPSAEALIDEADYARDERLPYWADLWPSAHVLAEHLAGRTLQGLRVLELGCGVGLPAVVAARAGARVVATDWYAEALRFCHANAARNGTQLRTLLVDWRQPPATLLADGRFDVVVAADVLYEERNGIALAELLPRVCRPDGEVVIADPRRHHAPALLDRLRAGGWEHRCDQVRHGVRVDESGPIIHLHRLRPPRDEAAPVR